ncbi:hypothetical protein Phum_PHUM426330 [Pediculus humanus corporis]|uniref:EGF-like domain-containing protein n=1 Tax=Pediculus humanus subsp. corporis TaxID=121224 RepID=E0VT42_PEDHC|nr:uncharacterized protein Phum_PHUM426330 [Pediculus humanus corporis]EEB16548.1 hypothetical protein Phum_PHUM426330 [Pediculus humanus corporis]
MDGGRLCHHTRHERTRYVSGKNQIYSNGYYLFENADDKNKTYVKFWERPLEKFEKTINGPNGKHSSSRPLFSWDMPEEEEEETNKKTLEISTEKQIQTTTTANKNLKIFKNSRVFMTKNPFPDEAKRSERQNRAKDSLNYEKSYVYTTTVTNNNNNNNNHNNRNNETCPHGKCGKNVLKSLQISCPLGFRTVEGVCKDVNECTLRNGHGPCQDHCTNTEGSYECSCENIPGTKLSSDNHTCVNLNECDVISAGCSHACILLSDVTYCTCPDGFELGDDWKTCHDIDECLNPDDYNVNCKRHDCINTIGSYKCLDP